MFIPWNGSNNINRGKNGGLKMDVLKMSIICNIQMLAEKVGEDISFKYLESKKYEVLWELREVFIVKYNKSL